MNKCRLNRHLFVLFIFRNLFHFYFYNLIIPLETFCTCKINCPCKRLVRLIIEIGLKTAYRFTMAFLYHFFFAISCLSVSFFIILMVVVPSSEISPIFMPLSYIFVLGNPTNVILCLLGVNNVPHELKSNNVLNAKIINLVLLIVLLFLEEFYLFTKNFT